MKFKFKISIMAITLFFSPLPAIADVTSVVVSSSISIGEFDGIPYTEVTGSMNGTVERADASTGIYSVPISYEFPTNSTDCNGFGIGEPLHQIQGPASLATIGSSYIFGNGYVHAAVGWDRSADANRSQGNTERLGDAYQVLKDLSSLLRNPSPLIQGPCAVDHVIGFGFSRTGFFWRDFLRLGNNNPILYDGILITGAGGIRLDLGTTRRAVSYPGPLPEDGLILAVNTEHDVERFQGWIARPETPSYRVYEVAGTPHNWVGLRDLAPLGATRQNPASPSPVFKAMLSHLHDWIVDVSEPPPSVTLPGTIVTTPPGDLVPPTGCTAPCPIYQFVRDEFGNAMGGIRLPHVEAPIATYTGVETNLTAVAQANRQTVSFGGTFTPFTQDTLKTLYRNHGSYIKMIAEAAGTARDNGWILGEDVGRYMREGAHLSVGKPTAHDGLVFEEP